MQWELTDIVFLGQPVSPFENAGISGVIGRRASNCIDVEDKVKKNKGTYKH